MFILQICTLRNYIAYLWPRARVNGMCVHARRHRARVDLDPPRNVCNKNATIYFSICNWAACPLAPFGLPVLSVSIRVSRMCKFCTYREHARVRRLFEFGVGIGLVYLIRVRNNNHNAAVAH